MKLRYSRKGWFRYDGAYLTGKRLQGTDIVIPDYVNGKQVPLRVDMWVGPFDTALLASQCVA